jgi:hypothetical protein
MSGREMSDCKVSLGALQGRTSTGRLVPPVRTEAFLKRDEGKPAREMIAEKVRSWCLEHALGRSEE